MNAITAPQKEKVRDYINRILPQAGMTGNVGEKVNVFSLANAGVKSFADLTEEHVSELIEFFDAQDPKTLVEYIDKCISSVTLNTSTPVAKLAEDVNSGALTFFESIALPLVNRGFEVCPCFPKLKEVHTRLVPSPLTMKSKDAAKIHEWGLAEPEANVCTYAEQKEGGLCFLDKDGAISLVEKYEQETGKKFPRTLLVQSSVAANGTPKGHWYFYQTPRTMSMSNITEDKTDHLFSFRVKNFYVVSIGSIHPKTGMPYAIADDAPIIPIPDDFLDWLLTLVKEQPKTREQVQERGKIKEGSRYSALISELGRLAARGYSDELMLSTGIDWAREMFDVPVFDEDLVRREIQHFIKHGYEKGEPTRELQLTQVPQQNLTQPSTAVDVSKWRDCFRNVSQMDSGPVVEIITGVLQEGVCFIGANPGDGKTLTALAFAKAITTGTLLFNMVEHPVPKKYNVIYLIPETRDRAFRKRCEDFQIPKDDVFLARTSSAGGTMLLDDPILREAVKQKQPVVFLDTAVRFMKGNDENSAADNRLLVNDVIALLQNGAVCVVLVHHATKAAASETMTLENMLRGTGDLAAMCDQVYGIRKDRTLYDNGSGPMEIDLVSLKDREQIGALTKVRLAASRRPVLGENFPVSVIHETGNFVVVDKEQSQLRLVQALLALVNEHPDISPEEIAKELNLGSSQTARRRLSEMGFHRTRGGKGGGSPWHQDVGGKCPYEITLTTKEVKKTLEYAVQFLKDFFARSGSDTILESKVLLAADKDGISDPLLNKARKRLGVVVLSEKGEPNFWTLPEHSKRQDEPAKSVNLDKPVETSETVN